MDKPSRNAEDSTDIYFGPHLAGRKQELDQDAAG
jgi:hypothetical protein